MSDLSPLSGEERKSDFAVVTSVDDPIQTSAPLPTLTGGERDHPILGHKWRWQNSVQLHVAATIWSARLTKSRSAHEAGSVKG